MGNDRDTDREDSPDWLRTFQTPLKEFTTISSSSPSSSSHDTTLKERPKSKVEERGKLNFSQSDDIKEERKSGGSFEKITRKPATKVVTLDSDSDQGADGVLTGARFNKIASLLIESEDVNHQVNDAKQQEGEDYKDEGLPKVEGAGLPEEDAGEGQERRIKRVVSALPLVFGDKVHRSKVLLECEGDALDVSGDVGAVGRISLSANHDTDFLLDLKGVIYKATIVPSNTFLVVNVGQSEAKVEAIMNDFVQLQPSANVFETETMVEGTLDGFGFDSDDDGDYAPVAAGLANPADLQDESKNDKKQAKQKPRSNKSLKGLKGSIKKVGKSKTTKSIGKGGGSKKHVKKASNQKRAGK